MTPEKQTQHYQGRVIRVTADEVVLPNGHRTTLDVVHHPGGATAVAVDAQQRVCMIRQYRYVTGGYIWELPAGKLEPNEPPLITAQRELVEEAGVRADHWHSLGSIFSSPGVFSEVIHLFMATGLHPAEQSHEHAEVIEVHWVPLAQAHTWALDGTLRDAKSIIALVRAFGRAAAQERTAPGNP